MKCLVTGGAGFIGSHLVERLVTDGHEVVVVDNLSTGRFDNIRPWIKDIVFVRGDIRDLDLCRQLTQGCDTVFHEAALGSVPRSVEDPASTHDSNVNGTLNLLIASRGVGRFVFAASSSAYGDATALPSSTGQGPVEDGNPAPTPKVEDAAPRPMSPYAVSKLAGEYYCRVFHEVYGAPTVSLRYFNVFGPKQDPASQYAAVVPKFITEALAGRPPVIFGDGQQSRDFTFVENVVEANLAAARSEACLGEVINVGCGGTMTVNDLAGHILSLVGRSDLTPTHRASRLGDVRHSLASIEKAERLLEYAPTWSVLDGLRVTIEAFHD